MALCRSVYAVAPRGSAAATSDLRRLAHEPLSPIATMPAPKLGQFHIRNWVGIHMSLEAALCLRLRCRIDLASFSDCFGLQLDHTAGLDLAGKGFCIFAAANLSRPRSAS